MDFLFSLVYPQYPYPNNAWLQQEHTSVEKIDDQPGVERSKKSASPEPDVGTYFVIH